MKCLVTGSSGFIGAHLVEALLKRKYEVEGLDKFPFSTDGMPVHQVDITDAGRVKEIITGFDFVFHLAGMLGTHELVDHAYKATMVNVGGTINVLESCKQSGAKMIFASKPNPWLNTYTITKIAAERFIYMYRKEYGVQAAVLKCFNVYGPGQPLMETCGYKKLIPHAIVNAIKGDDVDIYGSGKQTIDLIHTIDAVSAMLGIMDNWDKCEGHTFEAGHHIISVNDTIERISNLVEKEIRMKYLPMRKGETENSEIAADTILLKQKTGWEPKMSLEAGLKSTIDWYREHNESN